MAILRRAAPAAAALLLLLSAASAALVRQDAPGTIADIVGASGAMAVTDDDGSDFDVLQQLLNVTGLLDAVADPSAELTVFAPTDAAFVAAARALGFDGDNERDAANFIPGALAALGLTPDEAIPAILRYHVVPGVLNSSDVLSASELTTLEGGVITRSDDSPLELIDQAPSVANPSLDPTRIDIAASNGVIHVIDGVLLPGSLGGEAAAEESAAPTDEDDGEGDAPSIATLADGGGLDEDGSDFDILFALAATAGYTESLTELSRQTIFAPSDAAFIATAQDLGFEGADEEGALDFLATAFTGLAEASNITLQIMLTNVLGFHVSLPPARRSPEILALDSIPTVLGVDITRSADAPLALEDQATTLTDPNLVEDRLDIEVEQGVVHVIDRVLIPIDLTAEQAAAAIASQANRTTTVAPLTTTVAANATSTTTDDGSVCFPASAVLHLADGSDIAMSSLAAGHTVRVATTASSHSPVYLFTHRALTGTHPFLRLTTASGHAITLSASHYLYANGRKTTADAVRLGDTLSTLSGPSAVTTITPVHERGLVAPHTLHGDLVVNGVLASSYTRAVHPRLAHALLAPVRALARAGVAEPLGALLYGGADSLARVVPGGPDRA